MRYTCMGLKRMVVFLCVCVYSVWFTSKKYESVFTRPITLNWYVYWFSVQSCTCMWYVCTVRLHYMTVLLSSTHVVSVHNITPINWRRGDLTEHDYAPMW
jgi:hypothetical protein